jgi:opacity protein-like surface antigen
MGVSVGPGLITTTLTAGQSEANTTTATNSFYGGGASYAVTRSVKATVDFSKFANKNDTQLSNVNLGLRFNF